MEAAARYRRECSGCTEAAATRTTSTARRPYGTHENYLMDRSTVHRRDRRTDDVLRASRQVICGSGRVGIGQSGDEAGFQLSQRADYIEVEVGLWRPNAASSTPVTNHTPTRNGTADRIVIIGDANLAGDRHLPQGGLRATVALADGRELTALALQHLPRPGGGTGGGPDLDPRASHVVETWAHVLDLLERDPMECAELLNWPAKLRLLDGFRNRENLSWSAPRLPVGRSAVFRCGWTRAVLTSWSRADR